MSDLFFPSTPNRFAFSRKQLPLVFDDFPPTPLSIASVLQWSPSGRKINYDMHRHPSMITTYPDGLPLSYRARTESATYPPQPFLQIACPPFQEPIVVASSVPHLGVTVDDVLITMHLYLEGTANYGELDVLHHDAVSCITDTFQRRVGVIRDPQAQEYERFIGVKRIDFLMGRSRFLGLSEDTNNPHVFVLNVC
jgi:hypothetical protein